MTTLFEKGPLKITQDQGTCEININASASVGGGSVADVLEAGGEGYAKIHELMLADAGIKVLEGKYPAIAAMLETVRTFVDAEIAKI